VGEPNGGYVVDGSAGESFAVVDGIDIFDAMPIKALD
jgi:hypothetical protein